MNSHIQTQTVSRYMHAAVFLAVVALLVFAPEIYAQSGGSGAGAKVDGFFSNIITILKAASVAIVTIAFMFSGYQIAFAHKRISDVAPVLLGGLVVGGAAQFAAMLLS